MIQKRKNKNWKLNIDEQITKYVEQEKINQICVT